MDFGWIKINGISYVCKILFFDLKEKICDVEIGDAIFQKVDFSEIQPINGGRLPWVKRCATCTWYAEFEGVCCNGSAESPGDFRDGDYVCDCWEEKTDGESN